MKVDNKTDVYSFGVVTLEVIMGRHPGELISWLSSSASSSSSISTVDYILLNDVMDQHPSPPVNQVAEEVALAVKLTFAWLSWRSVGMPMTVSLLLRLPNNPRHWMLGQVDFINWGDSMPGYTSGVDNTRGLTTRHGAIGLIAWGMLLPFGAIIPRYFKHHDPQWFYLHISIQIVGFLPGLATVVAGRTLYNGLESHRISKSKIHRPIGSLVFFLSILQVMALILRPDKTAEQRNYWNWGLTISVQNSVLSLEDMLRKRKTKSPEADVEDLFAIWDHDGELLYEHIIQGIDNFSSKQCIDTGRYGTLYKTEMPIGRVVAVKKLHSSEDGDMADLKAFKSEIHTLTHIRHRNIIEFYGFSSFVENSFLVYEFMEKGSLRNILSNDEEAEKLDWMVRLNVVKGVAKALSYMHHDCSPPIIHQDISSNNVLLDSEYEAHVSDFSTTREEHELIFFAKLAYKMKVDNKTDVHSFRVVTLEVIMGKHPEELILSLLSSASSSSSSPSTVDHCLLNDVMDQRLPPPVN
ncbi:hypothetical protein VitviT2T_018701 [Vitis vinifera]|nr:hypothetical protein VitviT2T_018701 [Vitis vinifera]